MDQTALEPELVKDIRFLATHLCSIEAESELTKFLKGFLPVIAENLISDPCIQGRLNVTFLGARGVGKSTLFNWMAGSPLSRTGWTPQGGPDLVVNFLAEPIAVDCGEFGYSPIPAQFGNSVHRVAVGGLVCPLSIHDPPRDTVEQGAVLGRSDVVIFVASAERYADRVPLECAYWCALAGCGIVPVLNMVQEPTVAPMRDNWNQMMVSRIAGPLHGPLAISWFPRDGFQSESSEIAAIVWQSVCNKTQEKALLIKRQKHLECLVEFLGLIDTKGLRQSRDFLANAATLIRAEGVLAGRDLVTSARARLRSTGLSGAGARLLELLELPGPGRIWSLSFRLSGWPLRQWLLGKADEASHEDSESTVRRVLGNWIAKVGLAVFGLAKKEGKYKKQSTAGLRSMLKPIPRIDVSHLIVKAKELDALLNSQSNTTAREWLSARPGILGLLRAIIALAQGFSLGAAAWYGGAGFLSLVYLAVFAGLADMLLVLAVRLPLLLIVHQTLRQCERRIGAEIIEPCARLLEDHLAKQARPVAEAIDAVDRVKRTLAKLRTDAENAI